MNFSVLQGIKIIVIGLMLTGIHLGAARLIIKRKTEFSQKMWSAVFRLLMTGLYLVGGFLVTQVLNINLHDILDVVIIGIGSFEFTVYQLFFIVGAIAFMWMVNKLMKILLIKFGLRWELSPKMLNSIRHFILVVISILLISVIINFSDSGIQNFLRIKLFTINQVTIRISAILTSVIAVYGVSVMIKLIELMYHKQVVRKKMDEGRSKTAFQIIRYFIWVITIILLIDSLGVNVTVLIAGSAALFVGLGFGVQSLFNDFVSGILLLFDGSIRINHIVEIENNIVGKVLEVGLRTTKILTRDNIYMIIPNHKFVDDNVINWSYNTMETRFNIEVGVAYGSDVRLVEKLLVQVAMAHQEILQSPDPFVYFKNFGESALDFQLYFWVNDSFRVERIKSDLRFAIDEIFRENKISIPFPQHDLHLKSGWLVNKQD
ncbi:mechanosensitive ion channel protein MscS [Marinilabiliaceae bacterium JC017]|nr:mechanosensitive ion channel protein MscS [Marinilabiliaceae bacterium JC017]